jgi:hypothetical protein
VGEPALLKNPLITIFNSVLIHLYSSEQGETDDPAMGKIACCFGIGRHVTKK